MVLGVGVIGAGVMGSDHARLIRSEISGAKLVAVADADPARAAAAAMGAWSGTDPMALIAHPDVEAVIIASPDDAHAEQVLACIAAGKPVLCEKPLARQTEDCLRILKAEEALGRQLVTVGFMRRFDPAYQEIRAGLSSGDYGALRILHNIHRNQFVPHWFTPDMAVMSSFVHEIDISRWLTGQDPVAATVFRTGKDGGPGDPLMIMLELPDGALISTEVFIDARYGYHVHAEAVCAQGTIGMAEPALTRSRLDLAQRAAYPADWIPRFAEAYRRQDQAWVDALRKGQSATDAATARDGLMATHIGRQVVTALTSGQRVLLQPPGL